MRGRTLHRIWRDNRAAAAAEMALVTPLLLALLCGPFELARYFLDEHVVAKAVRDGARYAARQHFTNYTGCAVSTAARDRIRAITRTGQVASGGPARLSYWTDPQTITVSVTCDTSGTYAGIYNGAAGAQVVTVRAVVPYSSLFNSIGMNVTGRALNAQSQSAVAGI